MGLDWSGQWKEGAPKSFFSAAIACGFLPVPWLVRQELDSQIGRISREQFRSAKSKPLSESVVHFPGKRNKRSGHLFSHEVNRTDEKKTRWKKRSTFHKSKCTFMTFSTRFLRGRAKNRYRFEEINTRCKSSFLFSDSTREVWQYQHAQISKCKG